MEGHVSMEQKCCVICGKAFDTGAILLATRYLPDRRGQMRPAHPMKDHTITGYDVCPEDKARIDAGFVALVECDANKSTMSGSTIKPGDAYRTGVVAFLKREAAAQLFNIPLPEGLPMYFVEPGVIEKIQSQVKGEDDAAV